MKNHIISRRNFLATAARGALAVGILAPLVGSRVMAMGKSASLPIKPITLDLTQPMYQVLAKAGGALKIPDPSGSKKPIIVNRISETTVAAFSSNCPHFGCEVSLPKNNVIDCPCHGSTFDGSGKLTGGPARSDLRQFAAALSGTVITIKEKSS